MYTTVESRYGIGGKGNYIDKTTGELIEFGKKIILLQKV